MAEAWPGDLPAYFSQSYSETFTDSTIRTKMDAGPDKLRRRYTAGVKKFTGMINMTGTQVAALETFYYTTLNNGADAFTWTHPRTGAGVTFRFVTPPKVDCKGYDDFETTLDLEIMP